MPPERMCAMPPTIPKPYQVWVGQMSTWLISCPAPPAAAVKWQVFVITTLQGLITLLTPFLP